MHERHMSPSEAKAQPLEQGSAHTHSTETIRKDHLKVAKEKSDLC